MFSGFSDLISELANGKYFLYPFNKTITIGATSAAGRWHEWYTATGIPIAGVLTGAAGTGTEIKQSVQSGIYLGGAVSPDTRHILSAQVDTPASTIHPATAILCDFLVYWPSCVVTGAPTALAAKALPRYASGIGVQAIIAVQTDLGAASPALTLTCSYDAGSGAGSVLTSPVVSARASTLFANSGTPFMPLPAGKLGIKSIDSYTLGAGTTGTAAFFLVKPLFQIPILAQYVPVERDLVVQLPSMPIVYDDAYLGWIMNIGGAMVTASIFHGALGMGWG